MYNDVMKMTSPEKQAAEILEALGFEIRHTCSSSDPANTIYFQHKVSRDGISKPYCFDFALPDAKIGIEIDGEYWHLHASASTKVESDLRDKFLRNFGWKIVRIPGNMVSKQKIEQAILSMFDV